MQRIVYTTSAKSAIDKIIAEFNPAATLVVSDANVTTSLASRLNDLLTNYPVFTIPENGETCKELPTAEALWRRMADTGITRHSLIINLGGGVVTDLGGFCAATFKRGVPFINIPTSILGAVDAAVGGKTGINLDNLKNSIGVFKPAEAVIIDPAMMETLPERERLSGFAEMLKHALLDSDTTLARLITVGPEKISLDILRENIEIKRRIVAADPYETGLRKALNLGHTTGHAIETVALRKSTPVPHGFAVAWGLITALALSCLKSGFPGTTLHQIASTVKELYGTPPVTCDDYPALLDIMDADKKNPRHGEIAFTLLHTVGQPLTDQITGHADITAALDITRDLLS